MRVFANTHTRTHVSPAFHFCLSFVHKLDDGGGGGGGGGGRLLHKHHLGRRREGGGREIANVPSPTRLKGLKKAKMLVPFVSFSKEAFGEQSWFHGVIKRVSFLVGPERLVGTVCHVCVSFASLPPLSKITRERRENGESASLPPSPLLILKTFPSLPSLRLRLRRAKGEQTLRRRKKKTAMAAAMASLLTIRKEKTRIKPWL